MIDKIDLKSRYEKLSNTAQIAYLLLFSVLSFLGLLLCVFHIESRGQANQLHPVLRFFTSITVEFKYLLIVLFAGVLGNTLFLLVLLTQKDEDRRAANLLNRYYVRVLVTIPLVLVFYMVIRGVILLPGAPSSQLNPYGIAALSMLIGLSTEPILNRLTTIAQTFFEESSTEKNLERIGDVLGVSMLNNYSGFICLSFKDNQQKVIDFSENEMPKLYRLRNYEFSVWFEPEKPKNAFSEKMDIAGGIDTEEVTFYLSLDSDSVKLSPLSKTISFIAKKVSNVQKFELSTPAEAGTYDFWVEVYQKNRLIHVVTVKFYAQELEV